MFPAPGPRLPVSPGAEPPREPRTSPKQPNTRAGAPGVRAQRKAVNRPQFVDPGVKLGAVLLACLVWFYAATELNYRTELDIPLQVADPPPTRSGIPIIVSNPVPEKVAVVVSGSGKDILLLEEDALLLRLQLPVGRQGARRKFRLSPEQVVSKTERPVRVEEIVEPKEVEVVLDRLVEADLPVRAQVEVQVADSYTQVGPVEVTPGTVRVSGPASQVRVLSVLRTDSLVQSGVRRDISARLPIPLPEGSRIEMSSDQVTVRVDVQELAEYDIANVPVRVPGAGRRPLAARPSRVTVLVRGGADVIGRLDPESDIEVLADIQGDSPVAGEVVGVIPGENADFEVREIIPEFVTLVRR